MSLPRHLTEQILPLLHPAPWTADALCADHPDPDLWFAHNKSGARHGLTDEQANAIAICRQCPVRMPCLLEAIETKSEGIWGGTTTYQRKKLRIQQRIKGDKKQ